MIVLPDSRKTWGTPDFEAVFKQEVEKLQSTQLPLQQGLTLSSYVSDSDFNVVILNTSETDQILSVKTGIFYAGIIAGSCCSDDPTPVDEQTEYCEILFEINKLSAETKTILLAAELS